MITEKELRKKPLEEIGIFTGVYPAIVEDNNDPEDSFRLKVRCPAVADKPLDWALPRGVFAGNGYGIFALPQKGDNVWVTFQNGDVSYPIWEYGAISKREKPNEASKQAISIVAKNGSTITIQENGKIKISNKQGESLKDILLSLGQALKIATTPPPQHTFDLSTQRKIDLFLDKITDLLA